MTRTPRLIPAILAGLVSAMFLFGHATAFAGYHYEYYRDVYGNGTWGWTQHYYSTKSKADAGAVGACRVGTRVMYVGLFYNSQLLTRWPSPCGGTPTAPACSPISGYEFYYWSRYAGPRGGWKKYRGQIHPLAEGACSSAMASRWWREMQSVAQQENNIPWSSVSRYVTYRTYSWDCTRHRCSNGLVYTK